VRPQAWLGGGGCSTRGEGCAVDEWLVVAVWEMRLLRWSTSLCWNCCSVLLAEMPVTSTYVSVASLTSAGPMQRSVPLIWSLILMLYTSIYRVGQKNRTVFSDLITLWRLVPPWRFCKEYLTTPLKINGYFMTKLFCTFFYKIMY